mmetsp:Transcript_3606/g.7749  ORF Transcript_3606/g.7749 Transcript_3606/m.7749 type:complete len:263 (-) Transcript_3606:464-1252(-)
MTSPLKGLERRIISEVMCFTVSRSKTGATSISLSNSALFRHPRVLLPPSDAPSSVTQTTSDLLLSCLYSSSYVIKSREVIVKEDPKGGVTMPEPPFRVRDMPFFFMAFLTYSSSFMATSETTKDCCNCSDRSFLPLLLVSSPESSGSKIRAFTLVGDGTGFDTMDVSTSNKGSGGGRMRGFLDDLICSPWVRFEEGKKPCWCPCSSKESSSSDEESFSTISASLVLLLLVTVASLFLLNFWADSRENRCFLPSTPGHVLLRT